MVTHEIPAWLLLPFAIMLAGIAIFPLLIQEWWEKNSSKLIVALTLGIPTAIVLVAQGYGHDLMHQMVFDYVPFIVLLGGLFAVTGGIRLEGDIQATPLVNTGFLALGAVLASIMGTTGAAMLLIRPLLSTNMERKHTAHTVLFFTAVVANTGGLLTPLGDPPLFLLYLRGAPFTWFMHLAPEWLFTNLVLLAIYFITDTVSHRREDVASLQQDILNQQPLKITGLINFLWLAGVILSVAFINEQYLPFMKGSTNPLRFIREAAIMVMIILSLITTKKETRQANRFTWHPMVEVAYLFIGIFITMTPALLYLKAHAATLGLSSSLHFYFATGALSGFLDNAPTALAFHAVAEGLPQQATTYVANIPEHLLSAISTGAVFFGAMTYIGNGPNFMIKAIAVENGIKMPSFIAYIYRFSLLILLPLYILVGFIFL